MTILFVILHTIICLALILIVLLQTGKGSDLASAFGGGGQNAVFGGAGPASFLNKMTTGVAVLFMATSITLAYVSSGTETIMQDQAPAVEETMDEGDAAVNEEDSSANETVTEEAAEMATEAGDAVVDTGSVAEETTETAPEPETEN